MKNIMAFVIVGLIASSASFAAVGEQKKVDCKEINARVLAAKKAAKEEGGKTSAPAEAGSAQKAN
ncbi:MAG: hypothetical protein EOP11_03890 [Proteobacteria bacterium]|nr:MAG: hypothetical protein EOP11_03890 [Pseudomonadota bacterium]